MDANESSRTNQASGIIFFVVGLVAAGLGGLISAWALVAFFFTPGTVSETKAMFCALMATCGLLLAVGGLVLAALARLLYTLRSPSY